MQDCEICCSVFTNLSTATNGGAICFDKELRLSVFGCVFLGCKSTNSNSFGGSIYFSSSKKIEIFNVCAFESIASTGHFLYSVSSTHSLATMNQTTTSRCEGSSQLVSTFHVQNTIVRMYNSSFCYSGVHANFHTYDSESSSLKYFQFYKNKQNIIFGTNSPGSNHNASFINLISNGKTSESYGYIHVNTNGLIFNVDNIYAFKNEKTNIFNPYQGTINVISFHGDACGYTGAGNIIGELKADQDFSCTTIKKNILDCYYLKKMRAYNKGCTSRNAINSANILIVLIFNIIC